MTKKISVYTLSDDLKSLNSALSKIAEDISSYELIGLINKKQTCNLIFEESYISNVLRVCRHDKNNNVRFICVGENLDSQNRLELLNNNIEYITHEKFSQIDYDFFDVASKTQSSKVLVVEDDVNQVLITENILFNAKMQVHSVTKAEEVMDAIEEFQPDLILMDLNLDGVSGSDLVRIIRKRPDFRLLPIVFLTADKTIETRMKVLNAGADDLLTKPINPDLLVSALANRIQRNLQFFAESHDLNNDIIHVHDVDPKDRDDLMAFYQANIDNESASIIWLKLCDKRNLQRMLGYSGYKTLCTTVFSKLPLLQLKEVSLCQYLSTNVLVVAMSGLNEKKLSYQLEETQKWFINNSFSINEKNCKSDYFAVVLRNFSQVENIDSIIHRAESKLIDSGTRKGVIELKRNNDDVTEFNELKRKIEDSIKSRNFKWLYHKVLSNNNHEQKVYELELVIDLDSSDELKAVEYQDVVNEIGMDRLLNRFSFEHAIQVIRSNKSTNIDLVLLVKQSLVDYRTTESRAKLFKVLKKLNISFGKIVFEFDIEDVKKHREILKIIGLEFKQTNIYICMSGFENSQEIWDLADILEVDWIRLKNFDQRQTHLDEHTVNDLAEIVNKSKILCYAVLLDMSNHSKIMPQVEQLGVDYIKK